MFATGWNTLIYSKNLSKNRTSTTQILPVIAESDPSFPKYQKSTVFKLETRHPMLKSFFLREEISKLILPFGYGSLFLPRAVHVTDI